MKNNIELGSQVRIKKENFSNVSETGWGSHLKELHCYSMKKNKTIGSRYSKNLSYHQLWEVVDIVEQQPDKEENNFGTSHQYPSNYSVFCIIQTVDTHKSGRSVKEMKFGMWVPIEFLELKTTQHEIDEIEDDIEQNISKIKMLEKEIERIRNLNKQSMLQLVQLTDDDYLEKKYDKLMMDIISGVNQFDKWFKG